SQLFYSSCPCLGGSPSSNAPITLIFGNCSPSLLPLVSVVASLRGLCLQPDTSFQSACKAPLWVCKLESVTSESLSSSSSHHGLWASPSSASALSHHNAFQMDRMSLSTTQPFSWLRGLSFAQSWRGLISKMSPLRQTSANSCLFSATSTPGS